MVILANRIFFFSMGPLIIKGYEWLSVAGVNLNEKQIQFFFGVLNIVLAPILLACLAFFVSLRIYSGRWFFLLPVLFLFVPFLVVYIASLLSNNFVGIFIYAVNLLALVAVTPIVLKALSEIRYVFLISRISAIKRLQDDDIKNLFLRPFALDKSDLTASFGLCIHFLSRLKRRVRLEEVISRSAYLFGPLIAIGNPSEQRVELGAIREYFADLDDTRWQQYIEARIKDARHIYFVIDKSEFTVWETNQILKYGVAHKLILVVPDKYGAASSYFLSNPEITKSIGLTDEQIASIDRDCVLAICPSEEGCIFIRGAGRTAPDYLMAIDRAVTV